MKKFILLFFLPLYSMEKTTLQRKKIIKTEEKDLSKMLLFYKNSSIKKFDNVFNSGYIEIGPLENFKKDKTISDNLKELADYFKKNLNEKIKIYPHQLDYLLNTSKPKDYSPTLLYILENEKKIPLSEYEIEIKAQKAKTKSFKEFNDFKKKLRLEIIMQLYKNIEKKSFPNFEKAIENFKKSTKYKEKEEININKNSISNFLDLEIYYHHYIEHNISNNNNGINSENNVIHHNHNHNITNDNEEEEEEEEEEDSLDLHCGCNKENCSIF